MSNLIHFSETDLSDFSKDANGFRDRSYKEWWTEEELHEEYERLSAICKENMENEAIQEKEALVKFESLIQKTIDNGAGDRETAIRWLIQGEDLDINYSQNVEHFFWLHGLSLEKIDEFKKMC